MAHSVRLTLRAYDEIDAIVGYISRDSPTNAQGWRDSILAGIESLAKFPQRHAVAPEAELAGVGVRQMIRGNYRVLYTVESDVVTIHGVRHAARRALRPDELPRQS
jgi:plasmid stabilization system protein ParE